jgi:hypothetical protein
MEDLYNAFKRLSDYNVLYSGIISHRIRQKVLRRINPSNSLNRLGNNSTSEKTDETGQTLDLLASLALNFPNQLPSNIIEKVKQISELESTNSNNMEENSSQAKFIVTQVDELYEWAVRECEKELTDISVIPNEVAYSMIEEFFDYVTRSKNYIPQWLTFLNENLNVFMPPNKDEQLRINWKSYIELVERKIKDLEINTDKGLSK